MNILGIAGQAGSGKDTVANLLVDNFPSKIVVIALADPLKRIVRTVFGFEHEQLWGPTERRAERSSLFPDGPTAREALQLLGTEWGRRLYPDIWVRLAMQAAWSVLSGRGRHSPHTGIDSAGVLYTPPELVVIPDVRFDNELTAIQEVGGEVWLVWRPGIVAPAGGLVGHASEVGFSFDQVNAVLDNTGTLEDLEAQVLRLAGARTDLGSPIREN